MNFKNYFLCLFLLFYCFFSNDYTFAEIIKEPYKNTISLSISSFLLDKTTYNTGEKVKGEFILVNTKDQPVSNIKYSISLKSDFNKQMGYFEKTYDVLSYSNIFIDGLEKKTISFEYNIPDIYIKKDCAVEARVFSDTGLPLSTYTKKIKINGNDSLFNIIDSYIDIDGEKFFLQAGPSIRESREGTIKLKISDLKEDMIVFPKINVFDRSITGKLLKEEKVEEIKLKSNIINDIKINFTDIIKTPGVYEAELVLLDQNNKQLSEKIFFRYIVYGDIVTIQNVNTDSKEFKKGDTLNLNIYYTGSPYDLITGEIPKQSIKRTDITLKNYFGLEVSKVSEDIDYSGEGKIIVPMTLRRTADFLSANIKIYNDNGQILFNYKVDLSNREKNNFYPNIIIIIITLLLVIFSVLFIGKKKKIFTLVLIIFSLFFYKNTFALNPSDFIYFSNTIIPTLQDLNFYYVGGTPITEYGLYTENDITLNTVKVEPGTNFTGTMYAVLDGCNNARIAEVNFDNVGGTNIYKYRYINDPSSDGTMWPKGSGNGYVVLGDDNQNSDIGIAMDYFTAPMETGTYKIPLVVNTWEYTGDINFLTSGSGYMYVQVYEDGECGDANGKIYESSDINYLPYGQCKTGIASNTSFPNPGATSTWTCLGNNGGSDSTTCSASRKTLPEIKYFNVSSPVITGTKANFSWDSINTNNCDILGNSGTTLQYYVGVSTTTYNRTVSFGPGTYSYTLKCYNETSSVTKTTNYQVVETLPTPTLTLTGDSSVLSGISPTLRWDATNVKTCTKSGGWSGDVSITNNSTSGIEEPGPITTNTTYDMSCIGLNDSPVYATVSVGVVQCSETTTCECTGEQEATCDVVFSSDACGDNYSYTKTDTDCSGGIEIEPLTINCQAYQNFGSGSGYASREASTGTIYVNRDMDWRLFINDPNGNDSYIIESPQGILLERDEYYYLSKLYQNSGLKIFNAKVTGVEVGGEGACATSVNAVIGGQIIIEE
jgi:hypothetical protein